MTPDVIEQRIKFGNRSLFCHARHIPSTLPSGQPGAHLSHPMATRGSRRAPCCGRRAGGTAVASF